MLTLTWRLGKSAPTAVSRMYGSCVTHGNTAYFSRDYNIYEYCLATDKWTPIQQSEKKYFSLAVVDDKLSAIGGCTDTLSPLNTISSLRSGLKAISLRSTWKARWENIFPPMPAECIFPAATTVCHYLVVAGGRDSFNSGLSTVSVMNISNCQWSITSCLPQRIAFPQITLNRGVLYISDNDVFYSCSAEELVKSCCCSTFGSTHSLLSKSTGSFSGLRMRLSGNRPNKPNRASSCNDDTSLLRSYQGPDLSTNDSLWTRLADVPQKSGSGLVTLGGHVLAIGGRDTDLNHNGGAIHCYDNESTKEWKLVGELPNKRHEALCTVLPSNEVIVVGGDTSENSSAESALTTNEIGLGWCRKNLEHQSCNMQDWQVYT